MTNNWLRGSSKWYVRVAVATDADTPVPEGLRLFAGFWVKRSGSEGWAIGGQFELDSKIFGIPGTKEVNYKVIAKTDTGVSLESQVLNITDAPDTLDQDNYTRISYPGAAGFTEFEVYREDVATGVIMQIARDRNSSKLYAYDTGQDGRIEPTFPTGNADEYRAYAEVPIDAVSIDVQKTFHNLTIPFRVFSSTFGTTAMTAHLPTQQSQARAHTRFPRTNGDQRRPRCPQRTSCQRS